MNRAPRSIDAYLEQSREALKGADRFTPATRAVSGLASGTC